MENASISGSRHGGHGCGLLPSRLHPAIRKVLTMPSRSFSRFRILCGALAHEFAVHGDEEVALLLPEAWVSLGGLYDASRRGRLGSDWQVAEQARELAGLQ